MSKQGRRSFWAWAGAIVAGCGLCCIPLFVPLFGGTIVAGAISMEFLEGGFLELVLCGLAVAVIALAVFWLVQRSRRKQAASCKTDIGQNEETQKINIAPLK